MSDNEAWLARRLKRMQWLATGLVVAMAALFVVTSFLRAGLPALDYVWAFAEAALIGGLADWFAVTALFRRPLGLPIPHTAIVPNRKNDIGRALARFIARHFLVRDVVKTQLARVDLADRLGNWLQRPGNAASLADDLAIALRWLVRGADSGPLRESVKQSLRGLADTIPAHALVATVVDVVASGNHARALIDQLVDYSRDQLEQNRQTIRDRIGDRSPWWLPRFVDEEIYDQLIGEIERLLDEVAADPAHPARSGLNERLKSLKYALGHDPDLMAKSAALRDEILHHPEVERFAADLWQRVQEFLDASLVDPDSEIRRGLERQLVAVGASLATEPEIGGRLNDWLRELIVYIVENYRDPISQIISATIAEWDPIATARRIELQIGSDLQFIRINGTLVGGLVGLLLYALWSSLVP
jgi:uncharacterized membrane-anchored protein YjiN (DUF445 family)